MALILECLEAEPATREEIAEYVGTSLKTAKWMIVMLLGRGLIRRVRESLHPPTPDKVDVRRVNVYELVDPQAVSNHYHACEEARANALTNKRQGRKL